jgi:hypothetical protein
MEGKDAILVLLLVCMLLAVLVLAGKIVPMIAGGSFAAALVILGVLSRGFRKPSPR